jgi:FkbM family methyltransferase
MKKLILLLLFPGVINGFVFKNADHVLDYVKKYLPDNPVILEAGGRFGIDTRRMKRVWPNSVIHVFEPLPSSFETIIKNTEDLENIFLYPYALTTYVGTTDFYLNFDNNGASSIDKPVEFNRHEFEKIPMTVDCMTIDFWVKQYNCHRIDFMWLDMESHELYALQHALSILGTVKAIFTEINRELVRQGGCLYEDFKKFLEDNGFREIGFESDCGRFSNVLFMKD